MEQQKKADFFSKEKSIVRMVVYIKRPYAKDEKLTFYSAYSADAKDYRRGNADHYFAIERFKSNVLCDYPNWKTAMFYHNRTNEFISKITNPAVVCNSSVRTAKAAYFQNATKHWD